MSELDDLAAEAPEEAAVIDAQIAAHDRGLVGGYFSGEITEICPMDMQGRIMEPAKTHELKCWPSSFEPMLKGRKLFEYRPYDRDFQAGDLLRLREWSPVQEKYLNRELQCRIAYVLRGRFGVPDGFCIMSLENIVYQVPKEPV